MGRALARQEPVFRAATEECDALFRPELGASLQSLMWSEDGKLDQTGVAQPALFTLQYALGRLWRHWGLRADVLLGHSIGEYAAACLAGVIDLADAARLVAIRGRLMQGLPTGGGMMALAVSEAELQPWLAGHPALDLAAVNAARSVVIAGPLADLAAFAAGHPEAGAQLLRVSHAFHSRAMEPILGAFAEAAARVSWHPAEVPLISSLTGCRAEAQMAGPDYWVRQIPGRVRFADAVRALIAEGVDGAVELGPRPVLLGLVDQPRILRLPSLRAGEDTNATILGSLGALFSAGAAVDWHAVHGPRAGVACFAPATPFERVRHWIDAPNAVAAAPPTPSTALPEIETSAPLPVAAAGIATEDAIRAILAEAMQLPVTAIEPATPFVSLGADSLILTQVAARIERRFGIAVPRRDLFTTLNTAAALHRHVAAARPAAPPGATPETAPDTTPSMASDTKPDIAREMGLGAVAPTAEAHIARLTQRLRDRMPGSRRSRDESTARLADSRGSAGYRPALRGLLAPLVGDRAEGARIWDVDGREYVDITMGFGVQLYGHAAPFITEAIQAQLGRGLQLGPQARLAGEAARRLHRLTGVERVAFCNSGTEAVMTALRLARLATGRAKVALFTGSYHGHFDGVLGESPGTPPSFARDLLCSTTRTRRARWRRSTGIGRSLRRCWWSRCRAAVRGCSRSASSAG